MSEDYKNVKLEQPDELEVKIWEHTLERFYFHVHSSFEITLILSGSINQMCNGITQTLTEGDITFISPNCIHQYISTGEKVKILNLTFYNDIVSTDVWEYVDMSKIPLAISLRGDNLIAIKNTLDSICALSRGYRQPLEKTVYLKSMIEWLILKIFSCVTSSMSADSFSPAIIYIHSNFIRDISEKEVAEFMHYSPSYFSMLFKKRFGISFKSYLVNLRLDYAAGLLASTDSTVAEICEKCGFVTTVHFLRVFKHKFGITPTQYRNKNQNDTIRFVK